MESVFNFLSSWGASVSIVGIMLILFAKSITKIFRMGVTFKTELTTKEEMIEFKREIKTDLLNYKNELTKLVMDNSSRIIDEKLKDMNDIRNIANEMKEIKGRMEVELKNVERYSTDVRTMSENVRIMNNKINALEYGRDDSIQRREE